MAFLIWTSGVRSLSGFLSFLSALLFISVWPQIHAGPRQLRPSPGRHSPRCPRQPKQSHRRRHHRRHFPRRLRHRLPHPPHAPLPPLRIPRLCR
ncbi:hypothetical protein CPB84DRAFT_1767283 [Gymnopilus junonius]|uniref:Secreted protein n=1 Tax=Gymnopilus junonius TaxID=109634 RepID=A0A9P5TS63_GYMJU|nr:hypothetical protein CPB84DRAFT_1767283 [Gymnopilus junonius]